MPSVRLVLLTLSALVSAPLVASERAAPAPAFMQFGIEHDAPRGFVAMCRAAPELCRSAETDRATVAFPAFGVVSSGTAPSSVGTCLVPALRIAGPVEPTTQSCLSALTLDLTISYAPTAAAPERAPTPPHPALDLKQLGKINNLVNRHVVQASDADSLGVDELWRPSGIGAGAVGDCEDLAMEKRRQLLAIGYPPSSAFLAVAYSHQIGLHVVLVVRTDQGDYVLDNMDQRVRRWSDVRYAWVRIQSPEDPTRWFRLA